MGAAHGSIDQLHQLDRHQRLNSSIGDELNIILPFPRRSWLWGKKGDRSRSILFNAFFTLNIGLRWFPFQCWCYWLSQYWPSLISFSVLVLLVIPILTFVNFLFSVGVIGYPNVGKSSIINTLRAKKVCNVAPIAGETKVSSKTQSKLISFPLKPLIESFRKLKVISCPLPRIWIDFKYNENTRLDLLWGAEQIKRK